MTVIGAMARSVTIEGTQYFWSEYLLYNPQIGFRWLVHSDNHWNYVQAVPPGEVNESMKSANYSGKNYRIFQDAQAQVECVLGEFYWKVEAGEQVRGVDYVAPPYMLSKEVSTIYISDRKTRQNNAGPRARSTGRSELTYRCRRSKKRSPLKDLPRPSNIAPEPTLQTRLDLQILDLVSSCSCCRRDLHIPVGGSTKEVFSQTVTLPPLPNEDGTQVFFSQPFELAGRRNINIFGESPVQNTWVYLEGDLINEETGVVQSFPIDISYYQGVEDGESWSEGGQTDSAYTSALPARPLRAAAGGTVGALATARRGCHQDRTERDARFQPPRRAHRSVHRPDCDGHLSHRFRTPALVRKYV